MADFTMCAACRREYEDWESGEMISDRQESRAEDAARGQAEYFAEMGWQL